MECTIEMASGGMIYISRLMTISSGIQGIYLNNLGGGGGYNVGTIDGMVL
jgi:hypothetical protein